MGYMRDSKGRRLDSFEVEARAFTPPMAFSHLPGGLSGKSQYNGVSYNQDSVSTGDGKQYAGWYSETGALIIGKRTLPTGAWSTFDLSGVSGNPLVLPVDNDPHNNVSLIVDAQGYIHVAANMHGDVLRYVRSTNPHDITAWTAPGMTGLNEAQVTYPRFALHPDGTLFFMYRDGASGNGDVYLNRKNVGGAWAQLGMLAAGKATNENPYETPLVVSASGTLAVGFTWRPNGGDANTNNDVHYIQSTDKAATWKSVDGTTVALPLAHSNTSALVLDTAATNSGLINQFHLDLDGPVPHFAMQLADGATPDRNVHHVWWNGSAWVNEQVTNLGNGMSITNWTSRPAIACTAEGRTLIAYTVPRFGSLRGVPRLVDVTGSAATEVPLADLDLRDIELTFDRRALRERNELHFMVSHANADVNNPGPEYWDVNNFTRQWGAVISVDLAQIGVLLRREVRAPRIRTVQTMSVPTGTTVTNTSDAALTGAPGLLTTPDLRGKIVYARLTGRASTTGGTLTLSIFEVQQGGTSRLFGSIPFTATSTVIRSTPWIPLQYGPVNSAEALLQVLGRVSSTFTGTVSTAVLELGVMDGPIY